MVEYLTNSEMSAHLSVSGRELLGELVEVENHEYFFEKLEMQMLARQILGSSAWYEPTFTSFVERLTLCK